jgi:putative oxidoreductase
MSTINQKNLDVALLLLRIGVGVIFIVAGWGKLTGIEGTQGFFGDVGIPLAGVTAWLVAIIEFVGGLMVLVGYKIRIPALLLALVMVGALIFVKIGGGWSGMRIDITLLLMALALYMTGAGSMAIGGSSGSPAPSEG